MRYFIFTLLIFSIGNFYCHSQTITGTVIDYNTQQPLEAVSIYFDNTTIGATTNAEGKFSISYNDAIQSVLIISYLGYQKEVISDYRAQNNITVLLKESIDLLDEVVINADDGLTREQKLKIFRREFLGKSTFANSCNILNEKDLILRYYKNERKLNASSKVPIIIRNNSLQYEVSYDINVFEIDFINVKVTNDYEVFDVKTVIYEGSVFYKDLENYNERTAKRNRDKAYKGSVLEFIRAIYNDELNTKGYQIFDKKFLVSPSDLIIITPSENPDLKKLTLKKPITIVQNKERSTMTLHIPEILIDKYGNFSNSTKVEFAGYMANQRVGDLVPLDYNLGK
ncbi:carboxypeptidase-like regulatory domain-containing protein [Confluentibacter lentus]|uniref:carboxypeptidase-like regulatory domain-containing protein n=1 Tax=Confluentibacter lentus TaxID=1699412 RepID=UPI000C291165|nr:carboxypeptidase-like regulatory domain-containing protein [Confluentibacter lentus]